MNKYFLNIFLLCSLFLFSCEDSDKKMAASSIKAAFDVEINRLNVKFINQSVDANSYYWNLGNGVTVDSESFEYTYPKSGNYEVKLVVANEKGNYSKFSTIVGVTKNDSGVEAIFKFQKDQEDDMNYIFTDLSVGAVSYTWNFGDGLTSTEKSPTHRYKSQGKYNVSLEVKNDRGDVHSLSKVIDVKKNVKIQLDGNFEEWKDVLSSYTEEKTVTEGLSLLKITHDTQYIYLYVETIGKHTDSPFSIYIDRDNDQSTGWLRDWTTPSDLFVQGTVFNGGTLWTNNFIGKDLSDEWKWEGITPVVSVIPRGGYHKLSNGNMGIEFAIERTSIPDCSNKYFDFAISLQNTGWATIDALPGYNKPMLRYSFEEYSFIPMTK